MTSKNTVSLEAGTIEYYTYGSPKSQPILFIHGVLVNHKLWELICPKLAENYYCIVPTWPLGAHTQPLHPDADVSPEGMVDIIISFMDALQLKRATLVGNDSGGALCQMMVERHPQRIHRLVLTSCDAYDIWLPLLFKYLEFSAFIPGMLWLLGQTMRIRPIRKLPIAFGWLSKRMPRVVSDSIAAPLARSGGVRRDAGKFLRGISPKLTRKAAKSFSKFLSPVLIAWSRQDRFFPLEHAERLNRDFPDARLVLIEDAYTFSGIDNPTQLADTIKKFLNKTK
ncbi:MAG: alpha/beta hydrolase, partial [Spirochaetia bacterium]|nr:alpha/beta hydrolase [Spirochaetia bacterium]